MLGMFWMRLLLHGGVCLCVFLQVLFQDWGKMWTLDKLGFFGGLILCDIVLAVQQGPDGCLVSFPSKRGQTFLSDVILKMRCSCVLVKPHHISEITSTEWADFWRLGHDKDRILFLGFWGHCSMGVLEKQPLAVPFACSPHPVAQLIRHGARHVLPAYASVRGAAQGGGPSPRGTWGHGKLLGERVSNHGRMSES